jgi:acyl dehydratase
MRVATSRPGDTPGISPRTRQQGVVGPRSGDSARLGTVTGKELIECALETDMPGLYYEQFTVGMVFDHPWTRTITETDNVLFSTMTMNPQPLHLDAHFAATTEFGRPLVNSLFTLGLMIGMTINDTTLGTTIANLGMTDVAFPKPVFHGDTIHVRTKVIALRDSRSRPEVGIVEFEHTAFNQTNVIVAICKRNAMMKRMP